MWRRRTVDPEVVLAFLSTIVLLATGTGLAVIGVSLRISAMPGRSLFGLFLGCSIVCLVAAATGSYLLRRPFYSRASVERR